MRTSLTKPGCHATQQLCLTAVQPQCVRLPNKRRSTTVRALLDPSDVLQHVQTIIHHMPLAYEPVAAPCSLMNCGDVVHRSTLDPVLRKEVTGVDWKVFALAAMAWLYLFATPGVLPGALDYYITGPLQRKRAQAITKGDLKLGKLLGSGGFGSVYKAVLTNEDGTTSNVVVKKAKEFGEAEVWMNERMSRISPMAGAEFKGAFLDTGSGPVGPAGSAAGLGGNCVWLVWMDEGDNTLYDMMTKRDFPFNLEPILLDRELRLPRNKKRRLVTLKLVLRQLLEALEAAHATGIVHRDVKPQNAIVSMRDKRLKLIDWGAAADLRLGINYVPNEYLLDPRYAPPQQYVMSRQTATPPPKPVAALLSPVLWQMEHPDKFDMYSVGILFLQMVFPNLRSDNSLIAFNRRLQELGWDLPAWKREVIAKYPRGLPKEFEEGFEVMEAEEGAAWDLVCRLVSYNPTDRPTASEALVHPFLTSAPIILPATPSGTGTVLAAAPAAATAAVRSVSASVGNTVNSVSKKVTEFVPAGLLEEAFIHSDQQGLTEAWLAEEFGYDKRRPEALAQQRETIAWFLDRQGELQRKLAARQARFAANVNRTIRGVADRLGAKNGSKPYTPPSSRPASPGNKAGSQELRKGKAAGAAAAAPANGNGKVKAANPAVLGGILPLRLVKGLQSFDQAEQQVPAVSGNDDIAAAGLNGHGKAEKKGEGRVNKVKELINVFGRR